ncbi:glycosyltransferase [Alteribacter natronophilus]|uniref:glycosyltransferase n=1 Tax=Alteribacter natronophilus TaxID=2583810 RepID=UPI00110EE614|nr:glycosyltransferase [Alteribacter natronophilus]TMW70541.1 glycosyltransferase [Alteribacter natronophilus]
MKKKKVLFMLINMNIGGTERAFLNMVSEMPTEKYEITLLLLEKYGGFLDQVPSHVNVEYVDGYKNIKPLINDPPKQTALKLVKKGEWVKGVSFSVFYLLSKVMKRKEIFFSYLTRKFKHEKEYESAIAYAGPMDFISYLVLSKIKAKKKYQWIHFDITKIGFSAFYAQRNYPKFDKILVVSEEASHKLIDIIPPIKNNSVIFPNIVSGEMLNQLSKAGEGYTDQFDGRKILTVGRLSYEKGPDLAIEAASLLLKDGIEFKWYWVGEGKKMSHYQALIRELNLENHFILLGLKSNPYPYMADCDLYVQPSRYEGYCITTLEASRFKKPIVTTDVNGAREQFQDNRNGLIVEITSLGLYQGIVRLLKDELLQQRLVNGLAENKDIEQMNFDKII